LIWPLSIFVLNLADLVKGKSLFEEIHLTLRQKVWLLFTVRRISLTKFEGLSYFPAEIVVIACEEEGGKPAKKLLRFVKAETNLQKYLDTLKEHSRLYPNGVLASPTIPTMVFFTIALALVPVMNLFSL
jgi:hypothetical protein